MDLSDTGSIIKLVIIGILLTIIIIGSFKNGRFESDKFAMSLLLVFILPGLAISFLKTMIYLFDNFSVYKFLFLGFAIGIPFAWLVNKIIGFSTFEHEATHAFMALLFFHRITKFVITRYDGGYVDSEGRINNALSAHMISLAPYYFPLFAMIFTLVRPFLNPDFILWWDIWVGMWITFYFATFYSEIRSQWYKDGFFLARTNEYTETDIAYEGYIFSIIFIFTMSLFFYGLLFNIIFHNYTGIWHYVVEIFNQNMDFYNSIFG